VRAYLTHYNLTGKKVAFFTTQSGGEPVKALTEMKEITAESQVLGTLSIRKNDIKTNRYAARLTGFIERLKK